jgi:hypothetical protein
MKTNEMSPMMQTAFQAAFELRSARDTYGKTLADIHERLERASEDVRRVERYGKTIGAQAGDVVGEIKNITYNMRFDLLISSAASVEKNEALLNVLRPMLSELENARLDHLLDMD